jgi:hypothetical protein
MRWALTVVMVLALAAWPGGDGADAAADRLERFRDLGRRISEPGETSESVDAEAIVREMFALADAEIVDNLRSGGPFASPAFIQERLDAFTATWGGASFRVHRLGATGAAAPLTLGVFGVPGSAPQGSVRGYGRGPDGEIALIAAVTRKGVPGIHDWPAARDGAAQFAASWLGPASGRGGRPLTIEIWRHGGGAMERVWTSATPYPDGLWALGFAIRREEISVRYEPRYPGWKPGCEGQTEQVDVYRRDARRDGVALAARRVLNGWHRDLHGAVGRLITALAAGDQATVAALVPARTLRTRLPRHLGLEPACDQPGAGSPPASAVVAATEERDGRMIPWSLVWRRAPGGWHLSGADHVLQ